MNHKKKYRMVEWSNEWRRIELFHNGFSYNRSKDAYVQISPLDEWLKTPISQ